MSTSIQPVIRPPDPFDGSAEARLQRMGLLAADGTINEAVLSVFIQIFAASFFYNLCDAHSDREHLEQIAEAFSELAGRNDPLHIYLLISLQYDALRRPLPDPVWWLAGCSPVRNRFSIGFAQTLVQMVSGINHPKEDIHHETVPRGPQ